MINQTFNKLILTAALLLIGGAAVAQENAAPVEVDRPPRCRIVGIEALAETLAKATAPASLMGTPVTARVGLTEWLEARIGTDGLLTQRTGSSSATGIGNLQVGAKLRIWAEAGGLPVLSILPAVNIPMASADKGLGTGAADYTLAALTGTDVGRHAHIDVNYGLGAIGVGENQPHFLQHLVSASASAAVSDNWNPYVEAFWFSREDVDGRAVAAVDAGAIYELGGRYAVDGGVQFGMSSDAPAFAAFGGISIIVGDVLGGHGVHARQRQLARRRAAPPRR